MKNDNNDAFNSSNIVQVLINVIKENTALLHELLATIKSYFEAQKGTDSIQNNNINSIIERIEEIEKNSEKSLEHLEQIKKNLEKKTFILEVVIAILTLSVAIIGVFKAIK